MVRVGLIAGAFASLALAGNLAHAASSPCTFAEVIANERLALYGRSGRIGEQQLALLSELEKVTAIAKDDGRSVGVQLSPEQNGRFGEIRRQMINLDVTDFVVSARRRDLELAAVMMKGIIVFEAGDTPAGEQLQLVAALGALKQITIKKETLPPDNDPCSADALLFAEEAKVAERLEKLLARESGLDAISGQLIKRYGDPPKAGYDLSDWTFEDRGQLRTIQQFNSDKEGTRHALTSLDALRLYLKASLVTYETRLTDILNSGGDVKALGREFKRIESSLSNQVADATKIIQVLNERYPSDWRKSHDAMDAEIKKASPPLTTPAEPLPKEPTRPEAG